MTHPNIDYIRQFVNHNNPKDEYKLISEIGSGTYGDVYKAMHIKSQNYVAIKIMKIDLKDDVTAICQEIHTLRECKHENIVQFYGSYLQASKLWICMEFCGGQSMQDIYLNIRRSIDEDCIAFISRETLRGLEYMHKRGRIHRDIKGANILLTDNGDVKIADFGIAAKLSSTVAKRTTLIGTPYWMAPEVAAVNNRTGGYDERCDVWAVGITAIEYAELQPPLFDLHPMKALQILAQRTYTPPKLQRKDLWTPKFHSFIKFALLKNEKKRPNCETMLTHDFVTQEHLSVQCTRKLLKANNKDHKFPILTSNQNQSKPEPRPFVSQYAAPIIDKKPAVESENSTYNNKKENVPTHIEFFNSPPMTNDDDDFMISLDNELQKRGHRSLLKNESERNSYYDNCPEHIQLFRSPSIKDNVPASNLSYHDKNRASMNDLSISTNKDKASDIPVNLPARPKSVYNLVSDSNSLTKPSRPEKPPQYLSELQKSEKKPDLFDDIDPSSIPKIPKVHMGACFILIFEGCSLKINSSGSWINPETKEKLILLGTNDGIYYLNTNEMHDKILELLVPRRCLWLSVVRDTMMSLSGHGPQLYTHNLVSLIRIKNQDQTMSRITSKLLPRRLRPSCKFPDTKCCQMVSIIRNPFTGSKYMCAALNKQIFLYEWFSPRCTFIEIKRVDVPSMPCPLLNFDLFVSREQNFPIVCLGVYKTDDPDKYKLNLVNLQDNNRSVWFQPSNSVDDRLNVIKVLQIEPNTLLVCFPNSAIFIGMNGRVKASRHKVSSLEYGTHIESVVGLRDSILAFHTHGLRGVDFNGQLTQDINDDRHIYRLLSSDTYTASILVESKPTDNPMDNANVYMLVGHQDS